MCSLKLWVRLFATIKSPTLNALPTMMVFGACKICVKRTTHSIHAQVQYISTNVTLNSILLTSCPVCYSSTLTKQNIKMVAIQRPQLTNIEFLVPLLQQTIMYAQWSFHYYFYRLYASNYNLITTTIAHAMQVTFMAAHGSASYLSHLYVWISLSPYRSLKVSSKNDPIPEPVPPAMLWHNTNPSRLSQYSASRSALIEEQWIKNGKRQASHRKILKW